MSAEHSGDPLRSDVALWAWPSASSPASTSRTAASSKGVNFVNLRDAGDPVEVARRYDEQGADELAFLDIRASVETRGLLLRHDRGGRRRRCSFR